MTIILSILFVALLTAYLLTFRKYFVQRMHLKKFLTHYNPSTDVVPELLPIGTYSGKQWFVFKNPMEIPVKRSEMVEMFSQWADLNMTPDFARKQLLAIKNAINKDDKAAAGYIIQDILARTELAAHESILIDLAASLVLVEGENPRNPQSKFFEMKKQLILENEESKAFFLTYAFRTIKNFEALSETDFLNYLKKVAIEERMQTKSSRLLAALSQSQTTSKVPKQSLRTSLSQSRSRSKD
jgi:hypothetical protein